MPFVRHEKARSDPGLFIDYVILFVKKFFTVERGVIEREKSLGVIRFIQKKYGQPFAIGGVIMYQTVQK